MPGAPEFIPLPKAKEMFALSSWRDSPGVHGGGSGGGGGGGVGTQPSPMSAAADVLRSGQKSVPMPMPGNGGNANVAGHPPPHPQQHQSNAGTAPGTVCSGVLTMPSPLPASATALEEEEPNGKRKAAVPTGGTARAGRKQRGGKASHAQQQQQQVDIDDFFLHVFLPVGIAFQTFSFEIQAQASPLRMIDVGLPIVLFPRRGRDGKEGGQSNADGTTATATGVNGKTEAQSGGAAAGMRLSPFATPALLAAKRAMGESVSPSPMPALEEEGAGKSGTGCGGDFLLPPSDHAPCPHSNNNSNSNNNNNNNNSTTAASAGNGGVDEMYQVSLLFAEKDEAEKTAAYVKKRWPTAVANVVPRNRSLLNASLVLKGLPSMNKTEYILEELENLPYGSSYVRVHRGERGVYKNVVFVKYADREAAEDSKVRLERIFIGTRPLKVEFKKKCKTQTSDATASAPHTTPGAHPTALGLGAEDDDGTAVGGADHLVLQQMVRDLRVSTEHEGFAYKRDELTKVELKLLKQLCQSYGLLFDMTETKVTVKRSLGGNLGTGLQGTHSTGPSPALWPSVSPPTPAWAPATPAPLRPMDFKGIRHWKDIRGQQSTLGIVRPIGPEDGAPAFSAGRGRPI